MGLIQDADAVEIRKRLQELVNPVTIVHFTQELNLELGAETLQLMKELAPLSDKLSLQVFNFQLDKEKWRNTEWTRSLPRLFRTARTTVSGFTDYRPGTSFPPYSTRSLQSRRGIPASSPQAERSWPN